MASDNLGTGVCCRNRGFCADCCVNKTSLYSKALREHLRRTWARFSPQPDCTKAVCLTQNFAGGRKLQTPHLPSVLSRSLRRLRSLDRQPPRIQHDPHDGIDVVLVQLVDLFARRDAARSGDVP